MAFETHIDNICRKVMRTFIYLICMKIESLLKRGSLFYEYWLLVLLYVAQTYGAQQIKFKFRNPKNCKPAARVAFGNIYKLKWLNVQYRYSYVIPVYLSIK